MKAFLKLKIKFPVYGCEQARVWFNNCQRDRIYLQSKLTILQKLTVNKVDEYRVQQYSTVVLYWIVS